jgi:hypothetical protein
MNTEALIRSLAADAARPVVPLNRLLAAALAAGAAGSLALFTLILQPRADLATAIRAFEFPLKMSFVASLAVAAAASLAGIARPWPRVAPWRRLAPALLALLLGLVVELTTVPGSAWWSRLIGHNAAHCVTLIPVLSVLPAVCLLIALKHGAPARPGLAGAVAGLASAGVGACLYAIACPDDSPLFVATWYPLAIAAVTALCAAAGRRWLRW